MKTSPPAGKRRWGYSATSHVSAVVAVIIGLAALQHAQAQTTIAHWSFNSSTLSTDGSGNITGAADSTGNHSAIVDVNGVGSAAASASFAGSDSVSGAFGQGLRFNGSNYMVFPNLTELMASSGAPSYTVSFWINATTIDSHEPYSVLADWGLADSATAGSNSRYVYAFGPYADSTSLRAQVRGLSSSSSSGSDIYQANATTPSAIDDGSWHMLTWTFDTATGNGETYLDGSSLGSFGVKSGVTDFQMANSASAVGGLGVKGDSGDLIPAGTELDEAWVFDGALSPNQVDNLYHFNAIPEPSEMSLLGLGGGLFRLLLFRRNVRLTKPKSE